MRPRGPLDDESEAGGQGRPDDPLVRAALERAVDAAVRETARELEAGARRDREESVADLHAGCALIGLLANANTSAFDGDVEKLTEGAYSFADWMRVARLRRKNERDVLALVNAELAAALRQILTLDWRSLSPAPSGELVAALAQAETALAHAGQKGVRR